MKASPFQKLSNSIRKFSDAERSPFASCGEPLRAFSFGPQKFTPSRIVRGDHPMKKLVVFLSVVVALLSGCNGSNTVTVTFASPSQAIDNGQSVNITVTVKDSKNAGVTWTLSGPGALSKSGGNFGHLHGSSYWRRHGNDHRRFGNRFKKIRYAHDYGDGAARDYDHHVSSGGGGHGLQRNSCRDGRRGKANIFDQRRSFACGAKLEQQHGRDYWHADGAKRCGELHRKSDGLQRGRTTERDAGPEHPD